MNALAAPPPAVTRPPYDAELVIYRLEEAGQTLLSLPGGRASGKLPSAMPDVVRNAAEAYGWSGLAVKPPVPSAARISRMDEALAWVLLIPLTAAPRGSGDLASRHGGVQLRRIVGARMLVSPVTDRHLFSWRRIGEMLQANHESVRQWHGLGVALIVAALNRRAMAVQKEA